MALPARDQPLARISATRLLEAGRPDLELHNSGRGPARDLEIVRLSTERDEVRREPLARIPVLGAGVTYLVTLADADALPWGDTALQLVWRNHDGSEGVSCWRRRGDGPSLVEMACP